MMPLWQIALLAIGFIVALLAIRHGLHKDANQPKPRYPDEDLP